MHTPSETRTECLWSPPPFLRSPVGRIAQKPVTAVTAVTLAAGAVANQLINTRIRPLEYERRFGPLASEER
jgi:hypothetical protein